jgi:phenylalanyl-tRNA synthetase beta chain
VHPGQAAQILFEQKVIGWVGRIHPQLHQKLGLLGPVFLFEIAFMM